MKTIGFSVGDTIKLYWLFKAQNDPINPKELHDLYMDEFPGRTIAYDYMARIGKKMAQDGLLLVSLDKNKKMYKTTEAGKQMYNRYHELYYERLFEIQKVLVRLYYDLTKKGTNPGLPEKQLPQEFRSYFSKLLSIKDIVRYMIFSLGQNRHEFYIAEVNEQLKALFGWAPSNAYSYDIAREMELEGTIIGRWKEPEKRTIRVISLTEDGIIFSKQVKNSLTEQVSETLQHIHYLLKFINNKEES